MSASLQREHFFSLSTEEKESDTHEESGAETGMELSCKCNAKLTCSKESHLPEKRSGLFLCFPEVISKMSCLLECLCLPGSLGPGWIVQ